MRHHLFLAIACSLGAGQLALAQQDKGPVILKGHSRVVTAVSFSPNGKTLASADSSGTIKLWDLGTGKETWTIPSKKVLIGCIAFNPDGKLLAAGGVKSLKICEVSSGNELRTFVIKTELYSVAWSPDGKWFCSSDLDGNVRVWDVKTWNEDAALTVHSDSVMSVAFSPQGKLLASAGSDRT